MTTTELSPAAFAWVRLVEGECVEKCFDWLREAMGDTDDVQAVKLALYGAAAEDLPDRPSEDFPITHEMMRTHIACGDINGLDGTVGIVRRTFKEGGRTDIAPRWLDWCDRADAALALCRAIEAL